ncbi:MULTISPECIES: Wzz/FepE/Etk N-terminal domain-containing protein [unclassified Bradyrhizobium]|uniref:exopolysaccharide transport family protein n=1 Tax=unclassified Bradyrhizobium TaxID=2631580 RepID=UPI0024788F31|nr:MULTISPECIES: Wzz/FepE/Etk N-terminal domain-containing protein [unclassified Bradyrhizobium]WGR72430.1 Wzz/FepE/Etk N-terminal domain-containing protein [Bradyrhizobium sp. ISRA426]WGR77263.1 Wzz/FepE/Etk N-terminal domain-containing protein [Bradyrhizobium sp. ISRA430]WGR87669.1 Wzz/FepE/Etk N-terminal domain-containing protein [Bradyrhizobium sp. ISRA432]
MLDYNQPINRAVSEAVQPRPHAGFNVLELVSLLWRRKVAIVGAALLGATLAVTVGKSLTPRYTATAQLYVDPRELQLVDRELTPRAQDVSGMSMVVESQARLITSNSVLLKVIQQANLDKDPEFGGGDGKTLMSSLLGLVGLQARAPSAGEQKEVQLAALDALNKHITIRKTEKSFIVDIEVWSTDPAKAAMLANTLTNAYLTESRNSQALAARRATNDLSGRLKELRERLRNAETALATYKAQNNFVGTQDTLISDQQLSASNQRLAAARAATLDAQARFDQIEASRRTAADAGAIPEALQSPTIANLRAQYADARKKYAEQTGELGPRHPTLRQTEKQVEDLKRTINEEIDRIAQSAKNDLTRARDYEASLNRALEAQKRQSVQLSQAAVRLRELEREADASRDVYQSFLKRSRETEEQESLNTSAARVIGEATVPQRRSFPPAMSLFAMIGFIFGGLLAAFWFVAAKHLFSGATTAPEPKRRERTPEPETASVPPTREPPARSPAVSETTLSHPIETVPQAPPLAPVDALLIPIEKPLIARLQEADVIRTLGAILASGGGTDLTRLGWPTLRPGFPLTTLLNALRDMRTAVARRAGAKAMPVVALVGAGETTERSVTALNFALAAARDGSRVLMIDADHQAHNLSGKLSRPGKSEPSKLGWLSIGSKGAREIKTVNGISVLPVAESDAGKTAEAIRKAVAQARSTGGYDLVVLDGPAMPLSGAGRKLLDGVDAVVAVLPTSLDINDSLEEILSALGGAERKLVGVVLDELTPETQTRQRGRQYA